MFEIGISCVIVLALAYWTALWLMGRREDVLHGKFAEKHLKAAEPVRPIFPQPPVPEPELEPILPVVAEQPTAGTKPDPVRPITPQQPAAQPELLQSLLVSLKQEIQQLTSK
jgi:hypothetical protein